MLGCNNYCVVIFILLVGDLLVMLECVQAVVYGLI